MGRFVGLAICEIRVGGMSHQGITGEVGGKRFARIGGPVPHWTDTYRRLR